MSRVDAMVQGGMLRSLALAMGAGRGDRLIVLMYHRVLECPDALFPDVPDACAFDWQMALLHKHFRVLALSEAVDLMRAGKLPSRPVCVTFDDGYADNYHVALPILKRWSICATFFVASGYLDGGRMWNDTVIETVRRWPGSTLDLTAFGLESFPVSTASERRAALNKILPQWKYLPFDERVTQVARFAELLGRTLPHDLMMTSAQVAALHSEGMEIGAHTVSHPILTRTGDEQAFREISQGKSRLEEIVEASVRTFAYPNGNPDKDYDRRHVEMVRDAGFSAAVSTVWGYASRDGDTLQLPRIWPWDKTPFRYGLRMLSSYRAATPLAKV